MRTRFSTLIKVSALFLAQSLPLVQALSCSAAPTLPNNSIPVRAFSYSAPTRLNGSGAAPLQRSASSTSLNLSSTVPSTTAGRLLNGKTLDISVGNTKLVVNSNTVLTPAEKIAAVQVLLNGQQSLVLDAKGSADGGSLTIGPGLSSHLSSLIIPRGVTMTDITNSGTLNLSGNLSDFGSLYLTASNPNPALSNFSILASNITVGPHGLLSTILPSGSVGGTAPANSGLSLTASNNIVNAGTISSGGSLSLSAGGSITNALPQGVSGAQPLMQAANNINLTVGSGQITNSGLIASTSGAINISTIASASDLTVNASGGTFQALAGNINLRNASYTGSNNLTLNGGNYLSENLNLYSGTGTITAITGDISGNLNSQAGVEHFACDARLLTLRNNTISGDPTFVNTGGGILISGLNTFGENVAILAAGDITADSAGQIVDPGNNVTLVAGAGLLVDGTGGTSAPSGTTIANGGGTGTASLLNAGDIVFVNFSTSSSIGPVGPVPAGTGGDINLSASNAAVVIDTSAPGGSGIAGGSVTLAAFAAGTGGNVVLNTNSTINTFGDWTSGAPGGNVNIYAGSNPVTAINTVQVGTITTGGAGPGGSAKLNGSVNIFTAQPAASAGPTATTVTFDSTGTIGNGQPGGSNVTGFNGGPGGSAGSNNISFGIGGDGSGVSTELAGGSASATGGIIQLTGQTVAINGAINTGGGSFGGQSINAQGINGSVTINSSGGSINSASAIVSPSVSLSATNGNIGTSSSSPLLVNNGGGGLSLFASASGTGSNQGNVWITDNSPTPELMTLNNGAGASLSASVLFSVTNNNGSIAATLAGNTAISSPIIALTALAGNITADGTSSGAALFINSGGTSGLSLIANATAASGAGGNVNLSDANSEPVIIWNVSGASHADVSFTASANGSLRVCDGCETDLAISSPSISLTALGGNITADGTANGAALLLSSGSTSGLSLSANATTVAAAGGVVNLSDQSQEDVTFGTGLGRTDVAVSFTLSANGNLKTAKVGLGESISSPIISLTALGGNISSDGTAGGAALVVDSGGTSGLTLYVNSTAVTGAGGTVNLNDGNSEPVVLSNTTAASHADVSFTLSANGNISHCCKSVTAESLSSPSISLTALGGNISADGTASGAALVVDSGGNSGLTMYVNSTAVTGAGGTVNLNDGNSEPVSLATTTGPSHADVSFTLSTNGSIICCRKIVLTEALTSPSISLTALGGNISSDGTATGAALAVDSGGTSGLTLNINSTAVTGSGGTVNLIDPNSEPVALSAGPGASHADVSFTLSTNGSILCCRKIVLTEALTSPSISLTALGGNITSDGTATGAALAVDSGGNSGLTLYVNSTAVTGAGGTVNLNDGNSEPVALSNAPNPLHGDVSFTLSVNGDLKTCKCGAPEAPESISSPNVSLTALGGNISSDGTTSGAALSIDSGGTSGLSLSVNATTVGGAGGVAVLVDSHTERVTVENGTTLPNPLKTDVSFTLTANGSIQSTTASNAAISSPTISLTALGGNITSDGTPGGAALQVSSGGTSGLSLFANATSASGAGGNVSLSDANSEPVALSNAPNPLHGDVSFTLSVNGDLKTCM